MKAAAQQAELKTEMMMGTVAYLKDCDAAVLEKIIATKSRLLALPATLVRMIEGMDDLNEKIKIGSKLMEDALIDLSVPSHESITSRNRTLVVSGQLKPATKGRN